MSKKFLKIFFAVVMSAGFLGNASAALIVTNPDGSQWEYVDQFVLGAGPYYKDANDCDSLSDSTGCVTQNAAALNGLQVAELLFGPFAAGDIIATSTKDGIVNFYAWYDTRATFANGSTVVERSQSLVVETNGDGFYNVVGDMSAYVDDRTVADGDAGGYITYVFKSVEVSEPSVIALFSLALFGFGVRQYKKS